MLLAPPSYALQVLQGRRSGSGRPVGSNFGLVRRNGDHVKNVPFGGLWECPLGKFWIQDLPRLFLVQSEGKTATARRSQTRSLAVQVSVAIVLKWIGEDAAAVVYVYMSCA